MGGAIATLCAFDLAQVVPVKYVFESIAVPRPRTNRPSINNGCATPGT